MSGRDDDLIDIDTEGSVYRDPLVDFIDEMRELGRVPAPVPSPALAALLRGCAPVSRVALHPVRRVTGALLAAASIAVVVAAETHDLPAPAQQVVSNVIDHLSPLHWNGIADIQSSTPAKPQAVRVDPGVVHRLVLHPRAQVRTRVVAARTVVHVASTPVASSHRPAHAAVRRSAHKSRVRVAAAHKTLRHKRIVRLLALRHRSWHGPGSWSGWPQRWIDEARAYNRAGQRHHHRPAASHPARHHRHGHPVRRRA